MALSHMRDVPWPLMLDIDIQDTSTALVTIEQTITEEYGHVRKIYKVQKTSNMSAVKIQRAWRRQRRQHLHKQAMRAMQQVLSAALERLRHYMELYGVDRLAPSLYDVAELPLVQKFTIINHVKADDDPDTVEFYINVLKLLPKRPKEDGGLTSTRKLLKFLSRPERGRVALLVQNSATADLTAMEELLHRSNFLILRVNEPSLVELREVVECLLSVAKPEVLLYMFYVGRVASMNDTTYLVPADTEDELNEENIVYNGFDLAIFYENLKLTTAIPIVILVDKTQASSPLRANKPDGGFMVTCTEEYFIQRMVVLFANPLSPFSEAVTLLESDPLKPKEPRSVGLTYVDASYQPPFFIYSKHAAKLSKVGAAGLIEFALFSGRMERTTKQLLERYAVLPDAGSASMRRDLTMDQSMRA